MMRKLRTPFWYRLFSFLGLAQGVSQNAVKTIASSSLLVWIGVPKLDLPSISHAGQAGTRLWLLASKYNLVAQPLTQSSLLPSAYHYGIHLAPGIQRQDRLLRQAYEQLRRDTGLHETHEPIWGFRLGFANANRQDYVSKRIPVVKLLRQ